MSRTRLAPLLVLLALACNEPDAASNQKPAAQPASPANPDGAKVEPGTTSTTTGASETTTETETETETETDEETPEPIPDHFAEIGVALCDQYVVDLQRCIDEKVPEAEREAHRRTLADNHASWTQTKAGGESAAKGLQIGCRGAREQAKAATSALGCEW